MNRLVTWCCMALSITWSTAVAGPVSQSSTGAAEISASLQERFFDSAGVRIRYVETGQGTPVILVHGLISDADRQWIRTGVLAELAKSHRVIALDCRGHGKSGKPHDAEAYGAEMAKDVVRLLDHLKISQAHVVGFSMGAFIAGHLLAKQEERLLSVTMAGHHPIRNWSSTSAREAEESAADLEFEVPFRKFINSIPRQGEPLPEAEVRRLSQLLTAANDVKALAAYYRGLHSLAVSDAELRKSKVRTLAIIGSEDPALEGVREFAKAVPQVAQVIVEGASHGGDRGLLRHPKFLAKLRKFLAGGSEERAKSTEFVRRKLIPLVAAIREADYAGDRPALKRLHAELEPFIPHEELGSRVLYWRGFARWRSALNGFNDGAEPAEIEADLEQCVADFQAARKRDAGFIDALAGAGSCLVNHSFLLWRQQVTSRASQLATEAHATLYGAFVLPGAAENPRLLWVHAANQWYSRPGEKAAQDTAWATNEAALSLARKQKAMVTDPLEPSWGEPEALMSLAAWSVERDLDQAERLAKEALALVPNWHYVRDILLPQIAARKKSREAPQQPE